jgi:hypothetical protein
MLVKLNLNHPAAHAYPDLTADKNYRVLGIEADDFRLLNDEGKPYLYPPDLFVIVDPSEPDDWVSEFGEEGERYAYPKELGRPGFFEDYFDRDPQATAALRLYLAGQVRS